MENPAIKKFTFWDAIVLLFLLILIIPFLLGILEAISANDYEQIGVYVFLSVVDIYGIIKYIKKIIHNTKNK